jgi:vancomycin resistance protein YoaR
MEQRLKKFFQERSTPFSWRRIWLVVIIVVVALGILFVGLVAYAATYTNKVLPGVKIGEISVGGMERSELTTFLQAMNDKLLGDGLLFTFVLDDGNEQFYLSPVIVAGGTAIELLSIDIEAEVDRLINYGKEGEILSRAIQAILSRSQKPTLSLQSVRVDRDRIVSELSDHLTIYESKPENAGVKITNLDPLEYELSQSKSGRLFAYDKVIGQLAASWSVLEAPVISVADELVEPIVLEDDLRPLLPRLKNVFSPGSLTISFKDPVTRRTRDWTISQKNISDWLNVQHIVANTFAFGLEEAKVKKFLVDVVEPSVKVGALDAKFEIGEDGNIKEFQGSRPGRVVDIAGTFESLNDAILQRTRHEEGVSRLVQLSLIPIQPNLTTGEVNDLGISEVLGVGVSDFSGSPRNRRSNIRNAVKKLNGVLIKPGDDFSAIKYTEPYTTEGGYLPELVIKGDELKPEIAGGLCQLGTTLFRMAMNSGMPITQRRNHSLVVSYYGDLTNGLPGTDATLYDPAPDFRFKNDTGNYVLLQTEMDEEKGDLVFTLWGTNDGRKGWYEPPVVKRWINYGETKYIETTKLPPGEKECQHAFRGAEASFVYKRQLPDGGIEDRIFESYYRPLPEICLVGVEDDVDAICDPHEECYKEYLETQGALDEFPVIAE